MTANNKDLDHYLSLKWTYTVEEESHGDLKYYIVRVNEIPGVCTDSENLEEAMVEIKDALSAAIKLYLKHGEPVPVPLDREAFKGNIAYRTSPERHYWVAKMAQEKHQSMSKVIDFLIDDAISQTQPGRRL